MTADMQQIINDYHAETRRRVRQFGLRELLLLATCLALLQGIYRSAEYGVVNALLLTAGFGSIAWQVKRVDRWSDVPREFAIAFAAIGTLVLEVFIGWIWGSGLLFAWFPQHIVSLSGILNTTFTLCVVARTCLCLLAIGDVLSKSVAWVARTPLAWEEQRARFDLLGRIGLLIVSAPFWFSFPLRDLAAQWKADRVGPHAIVRAVLAQSISPVSGHGQRPSPTLSRLGVSSTDVQLRSGTAKFYDQARLVRYHLRLLPDNEWEVTMRTSTMSRSKLVGVCRIH